MPDGPLQVAGADDDTEALQVELQLLDSDRQTDRRMEGEKRE